MWENSGQMWESRALFNVVIKEMNEFQMRGVGGFLVPGQDNKRTGLAHLTIQ